MSGNVQRMVWRSRNQRYSQVLVIGEDRAPWALQEAHEVVAQGVLLGSGTRTAVLGTVAGEETLFFGVGNNEVSRSAPGDCPHEYPRVTIRTSTADRRHGMNRNSLNADEFERRRSPEQQMENR